VIAPTEPRFDDAGDVGFRHDQMTRLCESMQRDIAEALEEILGEIVVEDWVGGTPHEQHRSGDGSESARHGGKRCLGSVPGSQGHISHEVCNRSACSRSAVRRAECLAVHRRDPLPGQAGGTLHEERSEPAHQLSKWS
jgi:hypothetical protein